MSLEKWGNSNYDCIDTTIRFVYNGRRSLNLQMGLIRRMSDGAEKRAKRAG